MFFFCIFICVCIIIRWQLMTDVLCGVESCAIISVSGTRLLLCPLGLSDPSSTNDDDDSFFWLNLLLGDDGDDDEDVDIEAVCVQRGQEDHS